MSRLRHLAALALIAASASTVGAAIATLDVVPAATLLLPHFETDLANSNGRTTVFRIANVSAEAALAHVVLWTDLGIPTLNFDVYLAGYDVATIDLRLLFSRVAPQTSSTLVNHGLFSYSPVAFPGCDLQPAGQLPPSFVANLATAHTGQPSSFFGNQCGAVDHGDGVARGYVTIDRVNRCTLLHPSDPGYFSGPDRVASDENTLWGEYWLIDREDNTSVGDAMVHIEASATAPATTTPGVTTFYGRFVAWNANDHREALATSWQARAFAGSPGLGTTELLIWRDPGLVVAPFACGTLPAPFPLHQTRILAFDEAGLETEILGALVAPWATNAVTVGGPGLPTTNVHGTVVLDLDTSVGSIVDPERQSFLTAVHRQPGRWSVGGMAVPLDNAGTVSPPPTSATVVPGEAEVTP